MMKILVAIDSSAASEAVINEVARRPWPQGTIVCVLNQIGLGELATGETGDAVSAADRDAANVLVQAAAERLSRSEVETTTAVIEGYPRTCIAEFAQNWGADLIFVGSHGRGALSRFLLGSTAKAVVRHAPCSVEIVRAPSAEKLRATGGMKIILATDGSECSLEAARAIAERPWSAGSEFHILNVVEEKLPLVGPYYPELTVIERIHTGNTERARNAVETATQILRAAGFNSSEAVLKGNAKALILDEAERWDADLIVVGSHGWSGVMRLLMGSVSEAVAIHAHCSVEVVRRSTCH